LINDFDPATFAVLAHPLKVPLAAEQAGCGRYARPSPGSDGVVFKLGRPQPIKTDF
jgi:hypothetical protein